MFESAKKIYSPVFKSETKKWKKITQPWTQNAIFRDLIYLNLLQKKKYG